jgi:hypothetical protein
MNIVFLYYYYYYYYYYHHDHHFPRPKQVIYYHPISREGEKGEGNEY